MKSGLKLIEHKGFYIIAPFIFLLFKKWPTKKLIRLFVLSNFIICLYCFAKLIPFFIYEKWYFFDKVSREGVNWYTLRYITYHGGANFIVYDVHRLYVSFSVITSLFFLTFKKSLFVNRFLKYAIASVFVFVILLLQSKISVVLLSVLMLYYFIKFFKSGSTKKRIIISIVFLTLIGLGYYLNRIRFNQFIDQVYAVSKTQNGSFVERYQYLKCAIELIKEAPLFGYGAGDLDNVMKEKIIKYNYNYLLERGVYDPHNEFLKAFIGSGLIGFFLFSAIFISMFNHLRKENNKVLLFYVGFVFILCQIEPFLSRQAGILPALFFIGLLTYDKTSLSE
ncbi:O-antigen ligase family protein [Aestuariivivens marinum]|uniref:O-antigen ligase family protein n=1 Tax=Aestuariivivens marinum TaxID=2913555 RepID=UPI001F59AA1A|nr:O-antigen ligase family protein [Aestuariivivens marinum]